MGVEAFAEAAQWMLPGWRVEAVEDVDFLAPFKFYRNEPRMLTIHAVLHPQGDDVVADCRLIGRRTLPNQAEPQVTTHFTARVRLTLRAPEAVSVQAPGGPAGAVVEASDIYRAYFHGPAYRVLDRAWLDGHRVVGQMATSLPGNHYPPERTTLMAPRLIELCFQTAGLWEMSVHSRMGLPQHIDRVCLGRAPEQAEGPLYAVVTPHAKESFDAEVMDAAGNRYVHLSGYRVVTLPDAVIPEALKALEPVLA
jgi:hypothetical protein